MKGFFSCTATSRNYEYIIYKESIILLILDELIFFMPNAAVLTNKNAGLGTASQLQSRKSQGTSFTCYFVCWECHVHSQGIFLSLIPNVCLSLYAWYMCRSRPRGYSLLNLMKICNICVTELMNQQFQKLNKF